MSGNGPVFTDDERDRTFQIGSIAAQKLIDNLAFHHGAMVIHLPEFVFRLLLIDAMDDEVFHRRARTCLNAEAIFLHATSLA